jgi:hypothetical protein
MDRRSAAAVLRADVPYSDVSAAAAGVGPLLVGDTGVVDAAGAVRGA